MKAFFSDAQGSASVSAPIDVVLAWRHLDPSPDPADTDAWFDRGVALSTGSHGQPCDLIEAHKWFNIAARSGHAESARCRADLAQDMTTREIAEAQRRAREWLAGPVRA